MVYQGGLVRSLVRAAGDWNHYRRVGRRLRRWLEGGRVVLSMEAELRDMPGVPGSIVMKAIAAGADEVLIAPRRLTGLREIEAHPGFWDADYDVAWREGVESAGSRATREAWEDGLDHFARFHGFARFDEYYGTRGEVRLVGGYEVRTMEGVAPVLKEQLRRGCRMEIVTEAAWPDKVRGSRCRISVGEGVCGVTVPDEGVGLRIEYPGDGLGGRNGSSAG